MHTSDSLTPHLSVLIGVYAGYLAVNLTIAFFLIHGGR